MNREIFEFNIGENNYISLDTEAKILREIIYICLGLIGHENICKDLEYIEMHNLASVFYTLTKECSCDEFKKTSELITTFVDLKDEIAFLESAFLRGYPQDAEKTDGLLEASMYFLYELNFYEQSLRDLVVTKLIQKNSTPTLNDRFFMKADFPDFVIDLPFLLSNDILIETTNGYKWKYTLNTLALYINQLESRMKKKPWATVEKTFGVKNLQQKVSNSEAKPPEDFYILLQILKKHSTN